MKSIQMHEPDLKKMLLSTDPDQINKVIETLYLSPRVQGKIREMSKFYTLRSEEPDDILQRGLMLLYDMVLDNKFRGESKVETFLIGICKNLIRDSVRRVKRVDYKEALTDADLKNAEDQSENMVLFDLTDLEAQRDKEVEKSFSQLTEKCQNALKLYYLEGKRMAEIADLTNLSNANMAKKTVHRCRQTLRKLTSENKNLQNILKQLL